MNKNFEIEIRGLLNKEEYQALEEKLSKEGEFIEEKHRILIDYSTFMPDQGIKDRNKDIRLRVTNKIPEIIIKLGSWGGKEQREEISIIAEQGSFDNLVKVFNILGYSKGVLCIRNIKVFEYKDIEFALVEVTNHSYYYEAEKVVNSEDEKDIAYNEIKKVCNQLDLDIFDKDRHSDYVEQLNKEANEVFNFKDYKEGYFKERFDL